MDRRKKDLLHDGAVRAMGVVAAGSIMLATASGGTASVGSGACRLDDGATCIADVTATECVELGGWYQGPRSVCGLSGGHASVQSMDFEVGHLQTLDLRFQPFDDLDGARRLLWAAVEMDGETITIAEFTNPFDVPVDSTLLFNHQVAAWGFAGLFQPPLLGQFNDDAVACDPPIVEPGEACDYGGPIVAPIRVVGYTEDEPVLAGFEQGEIELEVSLVADTFAADGPLPIDEQTVAFGTVRLLYGYELVRCAADLDGSGAVDPGDIAVLLESWGACKDCPFDFDDDGRIGFAELIHVLEDWGPCAGG